MYEYIEGRFQGIFKDYVVIDHLGLGYKIYTSGNTMARMPEMGQPAKLYLRQIVREDFVGLYGFLDRSELELFDRLLTVNGVGAKSALSLLSIATPDRLKSALAGEDQDLLLRAPGIGKKTAMRILLELKDKFSMEGLAKGTEVASTGKEGHSLALEALLALGYTQREAEPVLKGLDPNASVEKTLKEALKSLMN